MKKFLSVLILSIILISFTACSNKTQAEVSSNNLDALVCSELASIENIESYDDETIKSLSVIIRTNIANKGSNYEKNKDNSNLSQETNTRMKNLVDCTSNQVLTTFNQTDSNENNTEGNPLLKTSNFSQNETDKIAIYIGKDDSYTWRREIKKYEILKFLDKHGVSLASLSNIEIESDDNGKVTAIIIGGKAFEYSILAKEFNLESNKITNFYTTKTSIVIEGVGKVIDGGFDISLSNNLAAKGLNYQEILNELLANYQIDNNQH